MANIIESELKMGEAYNAFPGAETVIEHFDEYGLDQDTRFADILDAKGWRNDKTTLVVAVGEADIHSVLALGKLAVELHADEFDWRYETHDLLGKMIIIRAWWD